MCSLGSIVCRLEDGDYCKNSIIGENLYSACTILAGGVRICLDGYEAVAGRPGCCNGAAQPGRSTSCDCEFASVGELYDLHVTVRINYDVVNNRIDGRSGLYDGNDLLGLGPILVYEGNGDCTGTFCAGGVVSSLELSGNNFAGCCRSGLLGEPCGAVGDHCNHIGILACVSGDVEYGLLVGQVNIVTGEECEVCFLYVVCRLEDGDVSDNAVIRQNLYGACTILAGGVRICLDGYKAVAGCPGCCNGAAQPGCCTSGNCKFAGVGELYDLRIACRINYDVVNNRIDGRSGLYYGDKLLGLCAILIEEGNLDDATTNCAGGVVGCLELCVNKGSVACIYCRSGLLGEPSGAVGDHLNLVGIYACIGYDVNNCLLIGHIDNLGSEDCEVRLCRNICRLEDVDYSNHYVVRENLNAAETIPASGVGLSLDGNEAVAGCPGCCNRTAQPGCCTGGNCKLAGVGELYNLLVAIGINLNVVDNGIKRSACLYDGDGLFVVLVAFIDEGNLDGGHAGIRRGVLCCLHGLAPEHVECRGQSAVLGEPAAVAVELYRAGLNTCKALNCKGLLLIVDVNNVGAVDCKYGILSGLEHLDDDTFAAVGNGNVARAVLAGSVLGCSDGQNLRILGFVDSCGDPGCRRSSGEKILGLESEIDGLTLCLKYYVVNKSLEVCTVDSGLDNGNNTAVGVTCLINPSNLDVGGTYLAGSVLLYLETLEMDITEHGASCERHPACTGNKGDLFGQVVGVCSNLDSIFCLGNLNDRRAQDSKELVCCGLEYRYRLGEGFALVGNGRNGNGCHTVLAGGVSLCCNANCSYFAVGILACGIYNGRNIEPSIRNEPVKLINIRDSGESNGFALCCNSDVVNKKIKDIVGAGLGYSEGLSDRFTTSPLNGNCDGSGTRLSSSVLLKLDTNQVVVQVKFVYIQPVGIVVEVRSSDVACCEASNVELPLSIAEVEVIQRYLEISVGCKLDYLYGLLDAGLVFLTGEDDDGSLTLQAGFIVGCCPNEGLVAVASVRIRSQPIYIPVNAPSTGGNNLGSKVSIVCRDDNLLGRYDQGCAQRLLGNSDDMGNLLTLVRDGGEGYVCGTCLCALVLVAGNGEDARICCIICIKLCMAPCGCAADDVDGSVGVECQGILLAPRRSYDSILVYIQDIDGRSLCYDECVADRLACLELESNSNGSGTRFGSGVLLDSEHQLICAAVAGVVNDPTLAAVNLHIGEVAGCIVTNREILLLLGDCVCADRYINIGVLLELFNLNDYLFALAVLGTGSYGDFCIAVVAGFIVGCCPENLIVAKAGSLGGAVIGEPGAGVGSPPCAGGVDGHIELCIVCRDYNVQRSNGESCVESCLADSDDLGQLFAGITYGRDGHECNARLAGTVGINLDLENLLGIAVAAASGRSVAACIGRNLNVAPGLAGRCGDGGICIVRQHNLIATCHNVNLVYECIQDVDCRSLGYCSGDAYRIAEYGSASESNGAGTGLSGSVLVYTDSCNAICYTNNAEPFGGTCRCSNALLVAGCGVGNIEVLAHLAEQIGTCRNLEVELLGTLENGDGSGFALAVLDTCLDGDGSGAGLAGLVLGYAYGEHIVTGTCILVDSEPVTVAACGPAVVGDDGCHECLCVRIDVLLQRRNNQL